MKHTTEDTGMNWTMNVYRQERRSHLYAARSDRRLRGGSHWTRAQLDERLHLLLVLRRAAFGGAA